MNSWRNIKLLPIFSFLNDFILFAPVAILYFAHVTGSYALGMSVLSTVLLSAAIFEVPTGVLSDYIGRKNVIICGSVAGLLAAILYAASGSYWMLLTAAVSDGLAHALFSGNNDAFLHDTLREYGKEDEFHIYLGKISSSFQVALAIAAVLGALIAGISFPLVMWLSVIPQALKLIVVFFLVEPKTYTKSNDNIYVHFGESWKNFVQNATLRKVSLASILDFSFGESAYQFRAAFVATLWPIWAIGLANMLANIGAAVGFFFSGKIIKKYKPYPLLLAGDIFSRFVNAISLGIPSILSPALMSTTSFWYGTSEVASNHIMQQEFSVKQRATMGSMVGIGRNIGFGVVSVAIGVLADHFGPRETLLFIQVLALSVTYLYFSLYKKSKMLS